MRARLSVFLAGLLMLGCSGSRVVPVSGRVTLDGKPLANAGVSFQPVASGKDVNPGSGSLGRTDADGRFTLKVVGEGLDGAYVGTHRVEISAYPKDGGDDKRDRPGKTRNLVPAKYNTKTTLTFPVPPGGTRDANFDLSSK